MDPCQIYSLSCFIPTRRWVELVGGLILRRAVGPMTVGCSSLWVQWLLCSGEWRFERTHCHRLFSKGSGKGKLRGSLCLNSDLAVYRFLLGATCLFSSSRFQSGFSIVFRCLVRRLVLGFMSNGSPTAYLLWAILSCLVSMTPNFVNIKWRKFLIVLIYSLLHFWSITFGIMTDFSVSDGTLAVNQGRLEGSWQWVNDRTLRCSQPQMASIHSIHMWRQYLYLFCLALQWPSWNSRKVSLCKLLSVLLLSDVAWFAGYSQTPDGYSTSLPIVILWIVTETISKSCRRRANSGRNRTGTGYYHYISFSAGRGH